MDDFNCEWMDAQMMCYIDFLLYMRFSFIAKNSTWINNVLQNNLFSFPFLYSRISLDVFINQMQFALLPEQIFNRFKHA